MNFSESIQYGDKNISFSKKWEMLKVEDAFTKYTDCSAKESIVKNMYEILLADKIEPHLGYSKPTVLIDYPSELGALADFLPGNKNYVQRWELYLGGIEIANCYTELNDPDEQRKRFAESASLRRQEGRTVYQTDEDFLKAMDSGMPPAGGIALGVDRLCMILANQGDIKNTIAFPNIQAW